MCPPCCCLWGLIDPPADLISGPLVSQVPNLFFIQDYGQEYPITQFMGVSRITSCCLGANQYGFQDGRTLLGLYRPRSQHYVLQFLNEA